MKNQPGQFGVGQTYKGIEQRVATRPIQPAQRRVSRHTVDADLQPALLQRRGMGARLGLVEVTAVTHAARHRETPGLERERKLRRRHHVPDHRAALQVSVALVAGVVWQLQLSHGKGPDLLRQRQPRLEPVRSLGVGQPISHRPRRLHQLQVSANRLVVVARVGAAGQQGDQ